MQYRAKVLVLGGGPAGGAAALGLSQAGCDVVLLERQNTPGWKIGETLPPEAKVHLQRLKHWEVFQQSGHLPCYGIVSCWGSPIPVERDFLMNPYGHGWQLDRVKFESALLQAAQDAGCRIFYGTEAYGIQYNSNEWCLETSVGEFHAEWLLDCTGRKGLLAKQGVAGSFESWQDYVSLYCVLHSGTGTDQDGRTYVESYPSGWAYSALMPNRSRILAFLTDQDLIPVDITAAKWVQQQIQGGSQIKQLLNNHAYFPIEKVRQVSASSGRYPNFSGSRWILVGDAGMTFDPLSGWGSTKAIVSAEAAVGMVLSGSDYQATCEQLWQSYLRQYQDYYLAEQRWSDSPFWFRRHRISY